MPRYRKKPVVIDAVHWDGTKVDYTPVWLSDALQMEGAPDTDIGCIMRVGNQIHIGTLEGVMIASPGDYILQGVKGEIYPCKPDIFELTYEPAKETP